MEVIMQAFSGGVHFHFINGNVIPYNFIVFGGLDSGFHYCGNLPDTGFWENMTLPKLTPDGQGLGFRGPIWLNSRVAE